MKKSKQNKYFIAFLTITAISAVLFVGYTIFHNRTVSPKPPHEASSSQPAESADPNDGSQPAVASSVPDMSPGDDTSIRPFERIDLNSISPTTMSDEQIIEKMKNILEGLMRLDRESLKHVSMRTTTGDYNPTYYMLAAAIENPDIRDAFLNAASKSKLEVMSIEASGATNTYTVRVKCVTPYLASDSFVLAAGQQSIHYEDVTRFAGSGAAKKIADMDLSAFPMVTDIVTFSIFMENDSPVILHPISENYGSRIPQYAFLWGGQVFQGTSNGDLLLTNNLGGAVERSEEDFIKNHRNQALVSYLNECLTAFKAKEFDVLSNQTLGDSSLGDTWFFTTVMPGYQKAFANHPGLESETMKRIASLDYDIKYFENDADAVIPQGIALVTLSVTEPSTGGKVIYTSIIAIDPAKRKELSGFDAELINGSISTMMENVLGGDLNQLNMKLLAK